MEEQAVSSLVNALIALIVAHPRLAAAVAAVWGIALLWKAQPKEKRDELTKRSPRVIGVIRAVLEIAPDLVGFVRVLVYQVFKGLAARGAPPSDPPSSAGSASSGFADVGVLRWLATVIAVLIVVVAPLLSLSGCPMPAPDGCVPLTTRCSPSGIPEVCSQSRRWSHAPPASPCAARGPVVCCWTRSPWGRELHACVPESACVPAPSSDAGMEVSDGQ